MLSVPEMAAAQMRNTLEDVLKAQSEINHTLAIENFIPGFRLGIRLAMESRDDDDGCLTDTIEGGW